MSLSNSEYQEIMREYDELRQAALRAQKERKDEVYAALPILSEIDAQLIHGSVSSARLSLQGNDSALHNLEKTNSRLIAQKKDLMQRAGYAEDYLKLKYRCSLCKDTGYIDHQPCRCLKQAIIDHFFMDPGRRELLERENFSTYDQTLYSKEQFDETTGISHFELMLNSLRKAFDFVEHFDTKHPNLLITGSTGVGKTFLTNCIAKALLDKTYTVMYLSAFRLFEIFNKYKFGRGDEVQQAEHSFDTILDCDLLIIDDLGTEMTNTYTNSQLFTCIEERFLRRKPIIISTNLTMEDIKKRYSERVSSRLFNFQYIRIIGNDIRIQKIMG